MEDPATYGPPPTFRARRSSGGRDGRSTGRLSQASGMLPGGEGDGMSINRSRGFLYKLARLLGDVNAVQKGRVGRRVGRRVAGRATGRGLGKLFK